MMNKWATQLNRNPVGQIKQWLAKGSVNRQILGAAMTVAIGTLLVKLVAFIKEAVVAWRFGTDDQMDAFLIALLVPSFIITVVAESFNVAFIPTYIQVREQNGAVAAQRLFSGATIWSIGLLLITTVLIGLTAPIYLPWIAHGFNPQKLNLTLHLLWVMTPTIILTGIVTIWGAVLNAGESFALAAICPVTIPIVSILLLVLLPSWGVFALAFGLVLGAVLHLIPIGLALQRQGLSLYPRWYGMSQPLQQVIGQYFPMVAGALLFCSANFIDQAMAAMLSSGSVAALNYGNRLISFPITLATTALSTAVTPYFSKMTARGEWSALKRTIRQFLGWVFAMTIPLTVAFVIFAQPLTQIVFQRGAFTASDTQLVAQIQTCFALQIPFYIANILVVRLLAAMKLNQVLMWVSGFSIGLNILLNYGLMQWLGISGIALSTSCVYLFTFLCTFRSTRNRLNRLITSNYE
jgi:putative peptidoglycan lipid II flippase